MNFLAIDTSTNIASLALSVGDDLVEATDDTIRQHAQWILPTIDSLLANAELSIQDLDGIIFGRGPGSFTGLRIACSMTKALAYAQDLPLYPVSSLAAIAFQMKSEHPVLSVIDARMRQVYWGLFCHPVFDAAEQVTDASAIDISIQEPFILAGVGFGEYLPEFPLNLQNQIIMKQVCYPSAAVMIKMVQSGLISPVTAADAAPQYLRNQVTHGATNG